MPFDALFLSAVTQEAQRVLQDGHIDKSSSRARRAHLTQLRGREGNCKVAAPRRPPSGSI